MCLISFSGKSEHHAGLSSTSGTLAHRVLWSYQRFTERRIIKNDPCVLLRAARLHNKDIPRLSDQPTWQKAPRLELKAVSAEKGKKWNYSTRGNPITGADIRNLLWLLCPWATGTGRSCRKMQWVFWMFLFAVFSKSTFSLYPMQILLRLYLISP